MGAAPRNRLFRSVHSTKVSLAGFKTSRHSKVVPRQLESIQRSTLGKFYKRGSQEKYSSLGRIFSCFPACVIEQDLFWRSAPCARLATHSCVARLGSSPSGFHRLFATRPVSSETSKQFGDQVLTMVLSGTRGP